MDSNETGQPLHRRGKGVSRRHAGKRYRVAMALAMLVAAGNALSVAQDGPAGLTASVVLPPFNPGAPASRPPPRIVVSTIALRMPTTTRQK
jgi:hypothetical protein